MIRFSAVYHAPWNFNVATNYALQGRRWSGPIITRVAAADPQFGPTTVTLSNGRVVSNPLATLNRFAFPTRDEGQFKLPALHVVNLRVGRDFDFAQDRRLQLAVDFFNVGNLGRFQGFLAWREPALQHQLRQGRLGAAAVQRRSSALSSSSDCHAVQRRRNRPSGARRSGRAGPRRLQNVGSA